MKTLKFVAFNSSGPVGTIIKFVTRSTRYSHIAVLDENGGLIECWPTRKNPFQHWMKSSFSNHKRGSQYEIWQLGVDDMTYEFCRYRYLNMAQSKVRYDWRGCLGFVFKLVKDNPRRLFCSEGCIRPLVLYNNWNSIKPSHVSPQRFVELIQAAGGKLVQKGTV